MKNNSPKLAFLYVAVFCLLSIVGCASKNIIMIEIPFQYKALAAGNEGVRFPVLPLGKEKLAFSSALLDALQKMEYSLIAPNVYVGEPLPETQLLRTDPVPLSSSTINEHNSSSIIGSIPLNAHYRLSYELKYRVNSPSALKHRNFSLMVWAKLERRAAGGQWHEYPKPYSGTFFANRLRDRIVSELTRAGASL